MMQEAANEARRENAQLSTGPKTEAGKQRSKFNARRHNLSGLTIVGTAEEMENYARFSADLKFDLHPEGIFEQTLVQSIADAQWQLNRARAMEQNILFESASKHTDEADQTRDFSVDWAQGLGRAFLEKAKELDLLSRYGNRFHRQVLQNYATLAKVQKERRDHDMKRNLQRKQRQADDLARHQQTMAANRHGAAHQSPSGNVPNACLIAQSAQDFPNQTNNSSFVSQDAKSALNPERQRGDSQEPGDSKRHKTMKQIAMEAIQNRKNRAA